MNAPEIRERVADLKQFGQMVPPAERWTMEMLGEIAAQLAESNDIRRRELMLFASADVPEGYRPKGPKLRRGRKTK